MSEKRTRYDKILQLLQDEGHRLTQIRSQIIKIFIEKQHLNINDIITFLKEKNDNVNIMSIYNTIDLLLDLHIIHANIFENKQVVYELSDNVVHAVCDNCHSIIHFNKEQEIQNFLNINQISDFLKRNNNFMFSHLNLEIHGTCSNCQKKIKKTQ